ncbi:MAG TPA: APC family permease [Bryobacteraceae bacterium]|nr:APC family permease [Bryobacteraceae bacterium]
MTDKRENGKLLRLLDVSFGVAAIVGGTLGVGILRTPGEVARHLQSAPLILLAWTLGGVYSMLGALQVTELGAALPQAGGFYVYVRRAFGEGAGFAVGWCDLLGQTAAVAFAAVTIAEYGAELLPFLKPWSGLVAIGCVVAFAALHWTGLSVSAKVQEWSSLVKALGFLALVVICFLTPPAASEPGSPFHPSWPAAVILAAQAIFYTFDGWYAAIYFAEEDQTPSRNLPRSMIGGVLVVTAIYLFLNAALLHVLPVTELAASKLPAAAAAGKIFGTQAGRLITVLGLISVPPLMNAVLMMATRILFAMSRDGLMPGQLSRVSSSGCPREAMLVCCAATVVMIVTGTTARLLAVAGFFYVLNYASAYVCVLALRRKEPHLARPFRAWGYPYTTLLVLTLSVAFLIGAAIADAENSVFAVLMVGLCVPLRRLLSALKHQNRMI